MDKIKDYFWIFAGFSRFLRAKGFHHQRPDQQRQHAADQRRDQLRPCERRRHRGVLCLRHHVRGHELHKHDIEGQELQHCTERHRDDRGHGLLFQQERTHQQAKDQRVDCVAKRHTRHQRNERRPDAEQAKLGWNPSKTTFEELVKIMVDADMAKVAVEKAGEQIRTNLAEYLEKGIVK